MGSVFGRVVWGFVGGAPRRNAFASISELPAQTELGGGDDRLNNGNASPEAGTDTDFRHFARPREEKPSRLMKRNGKHLIGIIECVLHPVGVVNVDVEVEDTLHLVPRLQVSASDGDIAWSWGGSGAFMAFQSR